MGKLILSTQMTVDGVISVDEWYVSEGEHDRAGLDLLNEAAAVLLGRLLDSKTFDSGVTLLRYGPAR